MNLYWREKRIWYPVTQKGGEPRFTTFDQFVMAAKAVLLRKMGKKVVSKKDVIEAWKSGEKEQRVWFGDLDSVIERLELRMTERKAALEEFRWLKKFPWSEKSPWSVRPTPRQPLKPEVERPENGDADGIAGGLKVKRLPFVVLPPGHWDIDDVIAYYKREAANLPDEMRSRTIDWKRLRRIKRLHPTRCFIGKKNWLGYVVFTFMNTRRVVLEGPIEGNANYILRGNWKAMARNSKKFLRDNYRHNYTKVVHKNDWIERVKVALYR